LVNLEESEIFPRGEVSCIIKLDRDRRSFISKVLLIAGNILSIDELRLLYLERSKPTLGKEKAILLGQLMQEIKRPDILRRCYAVQNFRQIK